MTLKVGQNCVHNPYMIVFMDFPTTNTENTPHTPGSSQPYHISIIINNDTSHFITPRCARRTRLSAQGLSLKD
jgi:hypothetical protein